MNKDEIKEKDVLVLPDNYHFSDENGHEVRVLGVIGKWCLVEVDELEEPYVLSLEFVKAIYEDTLREAE